MLQYAWYLLTWCCQKNFGATPSLKKRPSWRLLTLRADFHEHWPHSDQNTGEIWLIWWGYRRRRRRRRRKVDAKTWDLFEHRLTLISRSAQSNSMLYNPLAAPNISWMCQENKRGKKCQTSSQTSLTPAEQKARPARPVSIILYLYMGSFLLFPVVSCPESFNVWVVVAEKPQLTGLTASPDSAVSCHGPMDMAGYGKLATKHVVHLISPHAILAHQDLRYSQPRIKGVRQQKESRTHLGPICTANKLRIYAWLTWLTAV